MPSTFTTNLNLEQPARGEQVGTWDTPVNNNSAIIDSVIGGTATIVLTNSNVTLSAVQYQSRYIVFTGTITADIAITFPYVGSDHTIENRTAGAFSVTLQTTNASAEVIACPPYEPFDILTRASTAGVRYRNFGRIGDEWHYGGSSVPAWVSACTIPPYLNANGTAFSSATYPALATIYGGTTLPDAQGRARFTLNQTVTRISSLGGIDGNTLFAGGGLQTTTLSSANVPPVPYSDTGHFHTEAQSFLFVNNNPSGGLSVLGGGGGGGGNSQTAPATITSLTIGNASPSAFANLPPGYVGGLTLIRAA